MMMRPSTEYRVASYIESTHLPSLHEQSEAESRVQRFGGALAATVPIVPEYNLLSPSAMDEKNKRHRRRCGTSPGLARLPSECGS